MARPVLQTAVLSSLITEEYLSIRNKYTEGLHFVIFTEPCSINFKLISLVYVFKQIRSAVDVHK